MEIISSKKISATDIEIEIQKPQPAPTKQVYDIDYLQGQ